MCALNEDVVRHIVDYIPLEELERVNSANPIFFEAWMKQQYASVTITRRDKESKRLIAHLCEPHVAQHVRRITMQPWLVQPRTTSPRSRTENLFMRCMQILDPHYTQKTAERRLQKRLGKDTKRVTKAFEGMSRLQEYTIDWDENNAFHPEFYRAFLVPCLEKWAGHLTVLSIRIPLCMVSSLARLRLPYLESFTYHFCTGSAPLKNIQDEHDGFVVFLNNLKDSLQALSITSTSTSQHLDMSRIFQMMGTYPCLRSVSLSVPFDGGHISDPMTFAGFLSRHASSLKELSLTTSRASAHFKRGDPNHFNWVHQIIKAFKEPFPLLCSLALTLRPLRAPLDVFVGFLDMHAPTLRTVSLTDRALLPHEIDALFIGSPYSAETIEDLHIKVDTVSAAFLARLARRFPRLLTLRLEYSRIDVDHTGIMDIHRRNNDMSVFCMNLAQYREDLSAWSLQHISISPLDELWLHTIEVGLRRLRRRRDASHDLL